LKGPRLQTLLSRDLDGDEPGLDPHVVIDPAWILRAADQLKVSPDIIRDDYVRLVREHHLPLRLSWLQESA
jgi:hypothetical protein